MRAFSEGVQNFGHESLVTHEKIDEDCDFEVFFGVKSGIFWNKSREKGRKVIMLDKGYGRAFVGGWKYMRCSIEDHHPTKYIMSIDCPDDRFRKMNIGLRKIKPFNNNFIFAGSSQKYHKFYNLPPAEDYNYQIFNTLKKIYDHCNITFRPKPSDECAKPIGDSIFSKGRNILDDLKFNSVFVTHGSNACFEAVCCGLPCIILGEGIAKPISSNSLDGLNVAVNAMEKREQWLANVSYCHWTIEEYQSGEAFSHIQKQMEFI